MTDAQTSNGNVWLGKDVEIYPNQPLPLYDNGPAKAYAGLTHNEKATARDLFVIVCDKALVPRAKNAMAYANVGHNANITQIVASGVVKWPADGGAERYVMAFARGIGEPIVENDIGAYAMRPDFVINNIVTPLFNALIDLKNVDLIHGNICPTRIYDGGNKNLENIILGECLTIPSSYMLPSIFESVERAMVEPAGRGQGVFQDDMYALGVTLVMLLRTQNPMADMSDEEILRQKITLGSYAALTGKDRFTGVTLELLRGLLHDDVSERWGFDDLEAWLDGRRLSPKQQAVKPMAGRSIKFNDKEYYRPEILALDLNNSPKKAQEIIENGELELWIERSLENKAMMALYVNAVDSAQEYGRGKGYAERLASRVSMALYPSGPMHYKSLNAMPDGVGILLAQKMMAHEDLRVFEEFFEHLTAMFWVNIQTSGLIDIGQIINKFENCRSFVRHPNMGYGLERCLYLLNPDCPCLSDKLSRYVARTPDDLILALEDIAKDKKNRPYMPFDRHIMAFLSVKDKQVIDEHLGDLNASEPYKVMRATLNVIGAIQRKYRLDDLPHLADWMVEYTEPVLNRFHDRELRETLQKKITRHKSSGDVYKISVLMDNYQVRKNDRRGYNRARREYHNLRRYIEYLEQALESPQNYGVRQGKEIACLVSFLLAVIIIIGFMVVHFGADLGI